MAKTRKRIETIDQLCDQLFYPAQYEDTRPWEDPKDREPERDLRWVPTMLLAALGWCGLIWITILTFNFLTT